MNIAVLLISLLVGLCLSVPVAFCMGLASVVCLILFTTKPEFILVQQMINCMDNFTMLAVPLYIFVGRIMNTGGITHRIFDFCRALVGHFKGGMAYVNVLCSVIFAGMSGSALADTSGLGQIEIDAMEKNGFPRDFSAAVTAVSATIGPNIPPSITLVLYGGLAEVSIGRLFMAGILPGLLMGIGMCVVIFFVSKARNYPTSPRADFREIRRTFWRAIPALMTVVIIIGGILGGVFTPTEAAGIAAIYSICISFALKELKVKELIRDLKESAIMTGGVMLIMACSSAFSYQVTLEQIPKLLSNTLLSAIDSNFLILLIINVILIGMGMFIDGNSILAMTVPVFVPLAAAMGMDLVQFGIVMCLNVMIGTITPPFAMCYFSVCGVVDVRYEDVVREGWKFYIPLAIELIILCLVPPLSLWIPNLVFGVG